MPRERRILHLLVLFICLFCPVGATVPFDEPFQIVRPSADHKSMNVVKEGLAKLQEHDVGIALLSVVGPYHSGKSVLLNSLLKKMRAFIVGRKTSPETMGIWLCRTNFKASDGSEVWLMDSEGFFGPGVEESYDAKVFTVASLLGSHIVYNSVKIIDQQAVNLLEILMTQAQLFSSRSTVRATGSVPEFLSPESFPPLTWVVEDFVQELPDTFKKEGPIGFLTTYLEASGSQQTGALGLRGNESTIITKAFRDVRVAHLFLPATSKIQLQDISRLEWDQLTEEYRSEVETLRKHLLRNAKARQFGGKVATGPALAQALHFTIQALQQGMFQELPSLWTSWTTQVAQMALTDADDWFSALLQDVDRGEDPVPLFKFNYDVEFAREQAIHFYRNLIKDFKTRPQMGELQQRMNRHFDRKLQTYHERTRRWITELLTQGKEIFATYLASLVLPMDPTVLEKLGKATSDKLSQNFTSQLSTFSAAGRATSFGAPATMPTFIQEPPTQLSNDFRAQLSARALENDREVERIFKEASIAASEAVQTALKAVGESLMSNARMADIVHTAETACWRAFESKLGSTDWATGIPKYQHSKMHVRKDAIEARIARFAAAHEKRLIAHLNTGLQGAQSAYREKLVTVSMPAPLADINAQHEQLALSTREILSEFAKTLTDTNAFKEAGERLQTFMKEGLQHLQDKNVELWKVYADGATRCAAELNDQKWKDCGILCLFNNVPWWHKSISRRNLNSCFAKDSVSSKMSPELQAQVFDVWYAKDLGQAVAQVGNRFKLVVFTFFGVCCSAWWYLRGKDYFQQRVYGYYPEQAAFYQPQANMRGFYNGGNGYQPNSCYAQQGAYGQPMGRAYSPGMTQRRSFFGA